MKKGPPSDRLRLVIWTDREEAASMFYAGLDLSRKRLDFHLLDGGGETVDVGAVPPDADGLRGLSQRLARHGAPVRAAIGFMNGARFVYDRLELVSSTRRRRCSFEARASVCVTGAGLLERTTCDHVARRIASFRFAPERASDPRASDPRASRPTQQREVLG